MIENQQIHGPVPLNESTAVWATDKICKHGRCGGPARLFQVCDASTHDSPDLYDLSGFCSVECFICELMHTGLDNGPELKAFLQAALG